MLEESVPTLPEPVSLDEAVVVANSVVEFAPKQSACGAAFELVERQPTRGALGWIQVLLLVKVLVNSKILKF